MQENLWKSKVASTMSEKSLLSSFGDKEGTQKSANCKRKNLFFKELLMMYERS